MPVPRMQGSAKVIIRRGTMLLRQVLKTAEGMKTTCSKGTLSTQHAPAEATGLADNSADVVAALQSFHWFVCSSSAVAAYAGWMLGWGGGRAHVLVGVIMGVECGRRAWVCLSNACSDCTSCDCTLRALGAHVPGLTRRPRCRSSTESYGQTQTLARRACWWWPGTTGTSLLTGCVTTKLWLKYALRTQSCRSSLVGVGLARSA